MKHEDYINLVIERGVKKALDRIEAGSKMMGDHPGQVLVSRRKQMAAYEALTPEDLAQMEQAYGPQQVAAYIMDMEKRRRRSDAAKQNIT